LKCAAEKNPRQKKTKRGQRLAKKSSVNQCELEDSEEEILVVSHTQEEVNVTTPKLNTQEIFIILIFKCPKVSRG